MLQSLWRRIFFQLLVSLDFSKQISDDTKVNLKSILEFWLKTSISDHISPVPDLFELLDLILLNAKY